MSSVLFAVLALLSNSEITKEELARTNIGVTFSQSGVLKSISRIAIARGDRETIKTLSYLRGLPRPLDPIEGLPEPLLAPHKSKDLAGGISSVWQEILTLRAAAYFRLRSEGGEKNRTEYQECADQVRAQDLADRVFIELAGLPYQQLVNYEADRIESHPDLSGVPVGDSENLEMSLYNRQLDQIFGVSWSNLEKRIRQQFFFTHAKFIYFERYLAGLQPAYVTELKVHWCWLLKTQVLLGPQGSTRD